MVVRRRTFEYVTEKFHPTYYQIGGDWGFTCVYCKGFFFGYASKALVEDGLLDHYDHCDACPEAIKTPPSLQMRNEVQDMGCGRNSSAGEDFRNTYGRMR